MATIEPIKIEGLAEFRKALRDVGSDLPKALRIGMNTAMQIVVDDAKPKIPRRTGRAAASLKTQSTGTKARIKGGGNRAPYYPWLDFGGRVGKNKSVRRAFLKSGRYIWKSFADKREAVLAGLEDALIDVAKQAGLEVTSGG